MTNEEFQVVLDQVLNTVKETLGNKAKEYSFNSDRLSNFKDAARLSNQTPLQALNGFSLKHRVAFEDYIKCNAGNISIPLHWWHEKILDQINYLILAWALVVEKSQESQRNE